MNRWNGIEAPRAAADAGRGRRGGDAGVRPATGGGSRARAVTPLPGGAGGGPARRGGANGARGVFKTRAFVRGLAGAVVVALCFLAGCQDVNGGGDEGEDEGGKSPIVTIASGELKTYLESQDANTANAPLTVRLKGTRLSSVWKNVNQAVESAERYVILDLSDCTPDNARIEGSVSTTPLETDMNFIRDNKYIKGVVLPSTLKIIGDYAFFGCTYLTSVTIPATVTTIESSAFSGCEALRSLTMPAADETDETPPPEAFSGCDALTTIESEAFSDCDALVSVTIPAAVVTIGAGAFSGCDALVSVTFADDSVITNFYSDAFPGNLREVYLAATGGPGAYTRRNGDETWWRDDGKAYLDETDAKVSVEGNGTAIVRTALKADISGMYADAKAKKPLYQGNLHYQWQTVETGVDAQGNAVKTFTAVGSDKITYTPVMEDLGKMITVTVTASGNRGSVTSAEVGPVQPFSYDFITSADYRGMELIPGVTITGSGTAGAFPAGQTVTPSTYQIAACRIARYETTYELWNEVKTWAEANGYVFATSGSGGVSRPVTNISWWDAVVWCNAYSELNGKTRVYYSDTAYSAAAVLMNAAAAGTAYANPNATGYRLPTEAEWEAAARGGDPGAESWQYLYAGSDTIDAVAWYSGNADAAPHPVGTKAPNSAGIYDMSGNVWEWCGDWYYGTSYRAGRGGGWDTGASGCAVTNRGWGLPAARGYFLGFRVARGAEEP